MWRTIRKPTHWYMLWGKSYQEVTKVKDWHIDIGLAITVMDSGLRELFIQIWQAKIRLSKQFRFIFNCVLLILSWVQWSLQLWGRVLIFLHNAKKNQLKENVNIVFVFIFNKIKPMFLSGTGKQNSIPSKLSQLGHPDFDSILCNLEINL